MSLMRARFLAAFLTAAPSASCVTPCVNEPPDTCSDPRQGELYPFEAGAWWQYEVLGLPSEVPEEPKIVYFGAEADVPLRPGERGFPACSVREGEWGRRWQAKSENGVRRLVDEWFYLSGERTKIEIYCPYAIRVPEGDTTCGEDVYRFYDCQGAAWKEGGGGEYPDPLFGAPRHMATLRVEEGSNTPWETCLTAQIDLETCEAVYLPKGCDLERVEMESTWTIEAVAELKEVPGLADPQPALRVREGDETFWWVRGVGKVEEKDPDTELENLEDYCLPSEGCAKQPAGWEDLKAWCPTITAERPPPALR